MSVSEKEKGNVCEGGIKKVSFSSDQLMGFFFEKLKTLQ